MQNLEGVGQMKQQVVGRQQMASLLSKMSAPRQFCSCLCHSRPTPCHSPKRHVSYLATPGVTFRDIVNKANGAAHTQDVRAGVYGEVGPYEFPSGFPLLINSDLILSAFQACSFQCGAIFAHPLFIRIHQNI